MVSGFPNGVSGFTNRVPGFTKGGNYFVFRDKEFISENIFGAPGKDKLRGVNRLKIRPSILTLKSDFLPIIF